MQNKTIQGIKYWSQLLLLPLYGLSFLISRNNNLWLFGSTFGNRYTDNPRYLYLYVSQNRTEIEQEYGRKLRPVWISHKKDIVAFLNDNGYEAYYYHSFKGIWLALRAGVYIFDNYSKDINFWQSGGAIKINLWHGSGNKQTNHDNLFDKFRHPRNLWERWKTFPRRLSDEKPTHYTLSTSQAMHDIYVSAFASDNEHILINGQPRCDMLFSHEESGIRNVMTADEQELVERLRDYRIKGDKLLCFMPTFRDSEKKFFDVMDLELFNKYLADHNLIFLTKLHPKSKIKGAFENIDYTNIINAKPEIDVYTFLRQIDILVTDYSSIYTDFMLLNRPVIAFQFDWKEYCEGTRDCYIDQDEYMPEIKARTMQELMDGITQVLQEDSCIEKREVSKKRMFAYTDGQSSKRMVGQIMEIIEK